MATTEYADALRWLYALEAARGMDFKLERVALALKNLGEPQNAYRCIHVAGTNGKGSVSAMLHAVFGAAGYRTGLYVSPHLVKFQERIRVGSQLVSEDNVVDLVRRIRAAATVRGIDLTYFEFATVMAFLHFADEGIDVAVIEVGLGGRLDATNVITPLVSVITSIDLDHEEYLGDRVESVAAEKCGIIKAAVPVVVGKVPAEAKAVVDETARLNRARVWHADDDFNLSAGTNGTFVGIGPTLRGISLALRGRFQIDNAALAIATVRLTAASLAVADDAIKTGLSTVEWPGRLDVIFGEPMVIADGAHNTAAVRRLTAELGEIAGGRRIHLLFAVMRDKRWRSMLEALIPHVATVTLTAALPGRGEDPSRLAAAIDARVPVSVCSDADAAFEALLGSVPEGDAILVTGSLFLVGQIYPAFTRRREQLRAHASPD
jgi:dihydrofolate synthase/folylpolyglutamate synthase